MVIKLVVTDIDGTIVEFNSELKQETIDVFKALEQKGVKTVIATGRMYKATKNIVKFSYLSFKVFSHPHKKLMMRLDIIFPHFPYCYSTGKSNFVINIKITCFFI